MLVELFDTAHAYQSWLNSHRLSVDVQHVVVFDNRLVVTYKAN